MIRKASESDLNSIYEIAKEAFVDNWSLESFREFIDLDQAVFLVACQDDCILGYAVSTFAADQANLDDIAVAAFNRGAGIGQKLLDGVLLELRDRQVASLFLEVREHNSQAIVFYEKNNFSTIGRRKAFYSNPVEDALVMTRQVN